MWRRLMGLALVVWIPAAGIAMADVKLPNTVPPITGMASDVTRSVFWVAGASGNQVSAISPAGAVVGAVRYGGTPTSVQALAMQGSTLYVGDIGTKRESVNVYRLRTLTYGDVPAQQASLQYPDGAHEAAAMLVSPKGNIYLVTVDGQFYRSTTPFDVRRPRLVRVREAPTLIGVTDGTFSADGNSVVLRTLDQVIVLDAYTWKVKASAYVLAQPRGQALTLELNGRGLMLADGNALVQTALPDKIDPTRPTPRPVAASPTPTATPTATATATPTPPAPKWISGTALALIGAAALSLIAALVVAIKR